MSLKKILGSDKHKQAQVQELITQIAAHFVKQNRDLTTDSIDKNVAATVMLYCNKYQDRFELIFTNNH